PTRSAGAFVPDQQGALSRRDEYAPARRHLQVFECGGQPGKDAIAGEDAPHASQQVEDGRRTRDAEATAGVELVRLRPHGCAPGFGCPEVRSLGRTVAVVVRPADRLAAAVGEDTVLLEPDASLIRKAIVQVD